MRSLAAEAPDELWATIRESDLTPDALETAILQSAVLAAYHRDRSLPPRPVNGQSLATHIQRVGEAEQESQEVSTPSAFWRRPTRPFVGRSSARSGLPGGVAARRRGQRVEAAEWARGRRELEHEFAKVMRYRSIRDLATGDTGMVLADLNPIWLMSPLSVSDTLPLDMGFFDVVIYDEASQIPLEEAIPALYRASQTIVVGDRQQLPPTDFFSSKTTTEDEDGDLEPQVDDSGFELDSDSFLTQAAGNLPATLLGWHYRSRSESLISFSNAALLRGSPADDPRSSRAAQGTSSIRGQARPPTSAGQRRAPARQTGECYRTCSARARIRIDATPEQGRLHHAQMVRGLLRRKTGLSLGVVAFSQATAAGRDRRRGPRRAGSGGRGVRLRRSPPRSRVHPRGGRPVLPRALRQKPRERPGGRRRDVIILSASATAPMPTAGCS